MKSPPKLIHDKKKKGNSTGYMIIDNRTCGHGAFALGLRG